MRLLALVVLVMPVFTPVSWAEEAPALDARPALATDAQAEAAVVSFKESFRARGLKGDERLMQREYAMREFAKVQHRKVIDELAKVTRNRNADIRTSAITHLGKQRALAGYAGHCVLEAMRKWKKDATFTMASLSAISALDCLLAKGDIRDLMKHNDYSIRKQALLTIGELKDMRMLDDLVALLKELKLEKGVTWDGASAAVDTGTAGDGDQKAAEAKAKAAAGKNKRGGRGRGASQRDIGPAVLEALKDLTDQEFDGSIEAKKWADENVKTIAEMKDRLGIRAKDQAAEVKPPKK